MDGLYQIVEEPLFQDQIDGLEREYPRIEELKRALSWHLAHAPGIFPSVKNAPHTHVIRTTDLPTLPTLDVAFLIDDDSRQVHLLAVRIVDSGMSESE